MGDVVCDASTSGVLPLHPNWRRLHACGSLSADLTTCHVTELGKAAKEIPVSYFHLLGRLLSLLPGLPISVHGREIRRPLK